MGWSKFCPSVPLAVFLILLTRTISGQSLCCFNRIFVFGDSMVDGGNLCRLGDMKGVCGALPYGETYFHKPNGRWSDGRVIADFIAQAYGLPLPPPSMAGSTPEFFKSGANFAVGASRALNDSAYQKLSGLHPALADHSLGIQLQSFKNLLPTISQGSNVSDVMTNSLFIVGEAGGVDYNGGLNANKSMDELKSWVPSVVAAVVSVVNDLIELGATTLVVPGNYAMGCAPLFMNRYQSNNTADYDIFTGCVKAPNDLSIYHNTYLRGELAKLQPLHPLTKIVYADYYGAQTQLLVNAKMLGFSAPLSACCGAPGAPYNYKASMFCGLAGSQSCADPSKYISWDGAHLTEAANHAIADGVLRGPYAFPPL